jgi:hypothetical protein
MKTTKLLAWNLILFISLIFYELSGDNRIILYLKHAPEEIIKESIAEAKKQNLFEHLEEKTPGKINHKLMKGAFRKYFTPKLSGFIATYSGYMDISNKDGLLMFPLRHATPKIYIALSPAIELVKVLGETISHRQFTLNTESKLYLFERKLDKKKNAYWDVAEAKVPSDRKINPITLVIFAKIKNVVVPEGDFLTTESSHLILPDIYVTGNFDQEKILLHALDLKRYFETITADEKKAGENALQKMVTNL